MRTGLLFKSIIPLIFLLAASAQAATPDPFATTNDYVRICNTAKLKDICYQGYERALVMFMVGKNIPNICLPSQSGSASTDSAYVAAENIEIGRLVKWLKEHEQPSAEYRKALGDAIVAVYRCK
jgi:hypothetical protein